MESAGAMKLPDQDYFASIGWRADWHESAFYRGQAMTHEVRERHGGWQARRYTWVSGSRTAAYKGLFFDSPVAAYAAAEVEQWGRS